MSRYLTQNTADGLRVTIKSTLELTEYLLEKCGFKFVLTSKMNQDKLEVYVRRCRLINNIL